MSNIYNKRPVVVYRSKEMAQDLWNMALVRRVMSQCTSMLRMSLVTQIAEPYHRLLRPSSCVLDYYCAALPRG